MLKEKYILRAGVYKVKTFRTTHMVWPPHSKGGVMLRAVRLGYPHESKANTKIVISI
jgi:hypothetical protein